MARKREKPEWYIGDPMKLADQLEESITPDMHDFDDWNGDIIIYNGEMRMIVAALRGKAK
jgi:hypothetical protein